MACYLFSKNALGFTCAALINYQSIIILDVVNYSVRFPYLVMHVC